MSKSFETVNPFRSILLITLLFAGLCSNGQKAKPSTSGLAPVNGVRIYYEVYGSGKPVILLHGAFYTIDMNWSELIPELSKTHKVIAIEMQGHGHSPFSTREMTIGNFTKDVAGVLDYLKIDSADVVGYSMGGSVAYQFAIQYPKRLRKLVIISSTYKNSGWIPAVSGGLKGLDPTVFNGSPLQAGYNAVAPDTSKWIPFIKSMIVFADETFDVGDSNISKIKAPVLIISGDNDGLDKVELMKTYTMLGGGVSADLSPMPKSQLAIVPGQGHVSLMMQTVTILAYLKDFLQ